MLAPMEVQNKDLRNLMKQMTLYATSATIALIALVFSFVFFPRLPDQVWGSVIQGNEYQSTSTAASTLFGAQNAQTSLLKTGQGSLAQVVITGANTGVLNFYNATTTDINKRTGNTATSSILIASFPASTVAGTYTFDAVFTTGLVYDVYSGNVPTTTIMWR